MILEILSANGCSSISPFGNPQNMFIFYHFDVELFEFFQVIFPLIFIVLILLAFFTPKYYYLKIKKINPNDLDKVKILPLLILFFVFIISFLGFIPVFYSGFLILFYMLIFEKNAVKSLDIYMLGTFFSFFGFTDNLDSVIQIHFHDKLDVFLYTAFVSQFISNVPATLIMADFTYHWDALLWGASVGGFGTLFSSMANLIGYRLFVKKFDDKKSFLVKFHLISFLFFIVGIQIYFLFFEVFNWVR